MEDVTDMNMNELVNLSLEKTGSDYEEIMEEILERIPLQRYTALRDRAVYLKREGRQVPAYAC